MQIRKLVQWLLMTALPLSAAAQGFDHTHAAWDALLQKHVKLISGGNASQVNYKGFAADRAQLKAYTDSLSAVSVADYGTWSKPQQFVFLANAYNAYTIEKILTRYPDIKSIRDFGRVIGNPWKDRFFKLLGKDQHLDGIEHETMRAPGAFDDPRVHVAVNCASIGCPMLFNRALTADKLDTQLDDLFRRFMSDRSRNRYNAQSKTVEVSSIFDWYRVDFEKGQRGWSKVEDVAAKYANELTDSEADRAALRAKTVPVKHTEYDWSLNDVR